ncbi:hypothetical protein VTK56DRAFT_9157 [Thermocarpiscus australiensis]
MGGGLAQPRALKLATQEGWDCMPHTTTRKLGALFQDWIPHTPHLMRAYDTRAVEIAKCRSPQPQGIGIDATSIWAAATSALLPSPDISSPARWPESAAPPYAMNNLDLPGSGQAIESGAILLGLSSWHIHPGLAALDKPPGAVHVAQKDELVRPGSICTIGLSIGSPSHSGIYWPLPLSRLRYYGGPVMAEKSLESQGNRITIPQLVQVAAGCLT